MSGDGPKAINPTKHVEGGGPGRSVLDLIHAITGSDHRTKRVTTLLWHITAAACLLVLVVFAAVALTPSLAPFALPGVGSVGLAGVYFARRRHRNRVPTS